MRSYHDPNNDLLQTHGDSVLSHFSMTSVLTSIATLSWWPNFVLAFTTSSTLEGFFAMVVSGMNIQDRRNSERYPVWAKCQDAGDFATGLALFGAGIEGIKKTVESALSNDLSYFYDAVSIVALGQAIKSGYNFIKAAAHLLSSEEKPERRNEQRREVLFHGLKFVGYTLISCGFFPAGAAFIGLALAVSLYNNSPQIQRYCHSFTSFFSRGPESAIHDLNSTRLKNETDHLLSPPRRR